MERSIALAYEAVEHYPDRKLHITNELIHNPEVNDRLTEMNVNLIEKLGEGRKDFSTINDGDVVILPAFGASYEEMEMLNKKVCYVVDIRSFVSVANLGVLSVHVSHHGDFPDT